MFWDPMHVEGAIEFVPVANATYVLRGSVTPEISSVWLENASTHELAGQTVRIPPLPAYLRDDRAAP